MWRWLLFWTFQLAFLLRCSAVCERALGIHILHPLPPPASTLNSHHVIKSVVFALLRLDKKARYNMKKKKKSRNWREGRRETKCLGLLLFTPTHVMYKSWALGPFDCSAACLCRLPRSRERLSCVISLLSYTWRTLPLALALALSNTHTHTRRCWRKVCRISHAVGHHDEKWIDSEKL